MDELMKVLFYIPNIPPTSKEDYAALFWFALGLIGHIVLCYIIFKKLTRDMW